MVPFSWQCPFCNHHAIISESNYRIANLSFPEPSSTGFQNLHICAVTCPNPNCEQTELIAKLFGLEVMTSLKLNKNVFKKEWRLQPTSISKKFPDYIPRKILKDYEDACLIVNLVANASASMSRRCLQGMIRDVFKVSGRTLFEEINAIKEKTEPKIWQAIDAVRQMGNIGTHMKKDVNLIIDVEPYEAEQLVKLIELLINDWYVVPHEREKLLGNVIKLPEAKKVNQGKTENQAHP